MPLSPYRPPPTPDSEYDPRFRYSTASDTYEAPVVNLPPVPKRTTSLKPKHHVADEQIASSGAAIQEVAPVKQPRTIAPAPPRVPKPPVLRVKPHHQGEQRQPPRPLPRHKSPVKDEGEQTYQNVVPPSLPRQQFPQSAKEERMYQNVSPPSLPRQQFPQSAEDERMYQNVSPLKLPGQMLLPPEQGDHLYEMVSPENKPKPPLPKFPRPSETHVVKKVPTVPSDTQSTIYSEYGGASNWDSTFDSVDNYLDTSVDTSSASQTGPSMTSVSTSSGAQTTFTIQIGPGVGSESAVVYDPFVGSNNVFALNEYNIDTIAFSDDPAMVLFYDPTDPATVPTRDQFKKAADSKSSYTHSYGAVNCLEDPEFCDKWQINQIPMIKVFNEGKVVSTVREMNTFDSKAMTKFLDTLASISQSADTRSNERSTTSTKSKCSLAKMFGFKK